MRILWACLLCYIFLNFIVESSFYDFPFLERGKIFAKIATNNFIVETLAELTSNVLLVFLDQVALAFAPFLLHDLCHISELYLVVVIFEVNLGLVGTNEP